MGTKEEISGSYMDRMKSIHASKPLAKERSAFLVGANGNNIGGVIAAKLKENNFDVYAPSVDEFDVRKPYPITADTLILANGFSELDWFENSTLENIQKTFDINVVGSLKVANTFVNATLDAPHKKYIVFIGSMAYKTVLNGSVAYCASKAALAHATRCLAWELAPKGYNVFCIHPSNTENTPMSEKTIQGLMRYRHLSREQAESYWGAILPKAKWLQSEDIAEAVLFYTSGKADYMSGSNIEMAGGQR